MKRRTPNAERAKRRSGFALYEVMIGVMIFAIGIIALGHAVENCLNASALTAEEDRVRQVLANRMAEIQATPGPPDAQKETKVDTGYGMVRIIQKTAALPLQEEDADVAGVQRVTLTAKWVRAGAEQSRMIEFYVYRIG